MRKITKTVTQAFLDKKALDCGNSRTDGVTLFLHGNAIARHIDGGVAFSLAGWPTRTTKERLNGLFTLLGAPTRIHQDGGNQYVGVKELKDSAWYTAFNVHELGS